MQHGGTADVRVYTGDWRHLRRRHSRYHGRHPWFLAQVLQRAEGRHALGHPVFVSHEKWMVWERRSASGNAGHCAKVRGQHDLDVIPLLHPVEQGRSDLRTKNSKARRGQLVAELLSFFWM